MSRVRGKSDIGEKISRAVIVSSSSGGKMNINEHPPQIRCQRRRRTWSRKRRGIIRWSWCSQRLSLLGVCASRHCRWVIAREGREEEEQSE